MKYLLSGLVLVFGVVLVLSLSIGVSLYWAWAMKYIAENYISLFVEVPKFSILFYFTIKVFLNLLIPLNESKFFEKKEVEKENQKSIEKIIGNVSNIFVFYIYKLIAPLFLLGILKILFSFIY